MNMNHFMIRYLDPDPAAAKGAVADGDVSDAEIEAIYKEVDAQAAPEEDTTDETDKEADPEKAEPGEDQTDDKEANPDAEEKEDPDKSPEGEDPDKDKATDPADKEGAEKVEALKPEDIQAWAEKHKMTLEEAKDDLEKTQAVLKNYKTPEEIARALRSTQSEFDKLKNEKAKAEQEAAPKVFQRIDDDQFLAKDRPFLDEHKDEIVEGYRKKLPNKTDMMTDEAILDEVASERLKVYQGYAEKQEIKLKETAATKRQEVLTAIAEEDKKFIPKIKEVLNDTSDAHLLSEHFDIKHLLFHARGQNYHADMKASYEAGLKKGKEDPKIIGVKSTGSGAPKGKGGSTGGYALNASQKARAEEMFSIDQGYTSDQAHKMYVETWSDELKKDNNFVG